MNVLPLPFCDLLTNRNKGVIFFFKKKKKKKHEKEKEKNRKTTQTKPRARAEPKKKKRRYPLYHLGNYRKKKKKGLF